MDLLDEESHGLLLWAVRLQEVGAIPRRADLLRLAPPRRAVGANVAAALEGRKCDFAEEPLDSLIRRGLMATVGGTRVEATELGVLVIDALGLHPNEVPLFEIIEADLRSSDPLTIPRVVSRIAVLDKPLIVDPYCRRDQLEYLAYHTSVTRVLTSDRLDEAEQAELADFVDGLTHRPNKLRVRIAPARAIHDRHAFDDDRVVLIGDIDDARGVGATALLEATDLAAATRAYYRRVWKDATRLAKYKPDVEGRPDVA